jgi:endonuclease YncB( thermonuclease family)
MRRHKLISAIAALIVLTWTMDAVAGDDRPPEASSESEADKPQESDSEKSDSGSDNEPEKEPKTSPDEEPGASAEQEGDARADKDRDERATAKQKRKPSPRTTRARGPRTYLVTRVVDGDTIELGNGAGVRIVGIDTPEAGACGFEAATSSMVRMVQGKRVRLTLSDEDADRYGRLLRYVNVGEMDAGLRQIKRGLAIARYDSRDGYGFHAREPRYVAADRASKNRFACPKPAPLVDHGGGGGACAPGYSPCVPPFPPDVNCDDVNGPIEVTGSDPHGLDGEGDGIACE